MPKLVYDFTEGNKDLKDLLGGKGANLAEMTRLGLPVPPGFTITTEACRYYLQHGSIPEGLGRGGRYRSNHGNCEQWITWRKRDPHLTVSGGQGNNFPGLKIVDREAAALLVSHGRVVWVHDVQVPQSGHA